MEKTPEVKEDDLALACGECGGIFWQILKSGLIECEGCQLRREAPSKADSPEDN